MNLREILHNTLSVQSKSRKTERMESYITKFVNKIPNTQMVNDGGNIYVIKGQATTYPTIVAHTDTVHEIQDEFAVLRYNGVYFAWNGKQQVGVGGDDKVGIAVALYFLQEKENIKVAFFRDEEIGCQGSQEAVMEFFDDSEFVIQCDRNGNRDMVYSIMGEKLFDAAFREKIQPLVDQYDRNITTGMMTDVWQLRKKGLKVASTNLSCGYWKPHSEKEIVDIKDVENTVAFVNDIIQKCAGKQWIVSRTIERSHQVNPWGSRFKDDPKDNWYAQTQLYNDLFGEDACPDCGQDAVLWEEEVGAYFCYSCQAYLEEDEEVEMEVMIDVVAD